MARRRGRSSGGVFASVVCVALLFLSLAVRMPGIGFGLPHALARPDEDTIVAKTLRMEELGPNPQFFSYPSLMLYTAYACFKAVVWEESTHHAAPAPTLNLFFQQRPETFHLIIRCISVVCGALTAVAVFLAARRLFGRRCAMLSGLILALCYLHIRDSHFGVTDVPCVCLMAFAFWQIAGLYQTGRGRHLAWAAILTGLAIGTKYSAAALVWPLAAAIVRANLGMGGKNRWRRLAVHGLLAATITLAAFVLTTPYFFLDFGRAWEDFTWEMKLAAYDPQLPSDMPRGWAYHARVSLWYGLGWPVFLTAVGAGLAMAARRSGKGLLLWSLPVMYYLFTARTNRVFERHMDPVLPFMAIAGGWAVRSAWVWLRRRQRLRGKGRGLRLAVPLAATMVLLVPSMASSWSMSRCLMRPDTRLELRAWMDKHVPEHRLVLWSGDWASVPYMRHHRIMDNVAPTMELAEKHPAILETFDFEWVVLVQWPVLYHLPPGDKRERGFLRTKMQGRYELVHEIDAYKGNLPADLVPPLDYFFMSFQKPEIMDRPGPGFSIYRRIREAEATKDEGRRMKPSAR